MTLTLNLTPDLEQSLLEEADLRGMPAEEYTLQILREHLPPKDRAERLIALLESWINEGDAEEQRETGEYLMRVLDEDRPSYRKLFPPELKGVTW